MRRMALDHNRAAGGQCAGGVATGSRESQREVRRTKHGHRADWTLHQPDFGPRQRSTVGQRLVMATVQLRTRFDVIGKQGQLTRCATPLANQAGFGQAGFLAAQRSDVIAARVDFLGDLAQEAGTLGAG